jgi:GAF domain-containing protein
MRRRARFTPYIRRRHAKDTADSTRTALRMEVFGERCYVLVQRGIPHAVLEAARTRRDLLLSVVARPTAVAFRGWGRRLRSFGRIT